MRRFLGSLLFLIGLLIIGSNLHWWSPLVLAILNNLWPLLLIFVGVWLISRDRLWALVIVLLIAVAIVGSGLLVPAVWSRLTSSDAAGRHEMRRSWGWDWRWSWPPAAGSQPTSTPSASPSTTPPDSRANGSEPDQALPHRLPQPLWNWP